MKVEEMKDLCPTCGKKVYGILAMGWFWCSSYGETLPLIGEFPNACGYRLMCG